jgi:phosphatidylinositol 4-phosphatase
LIAVTQAAKVGELLGHEVFRVEATEIVPIGLPRPRLSAQQVSGGKAERPRTVRACRLSKARGQAEDDRTYLAMLREITNTGFFFFSYTGDLTRSLQAQSRQTVPASTPLHRRVRTPLEG